MDELVLCGEETEHKSNEQDSDEIISADALYDGEVAEVLESDSLKHENEALVLDGDLTELRQEFPELSSKGSVTELDNPTRYAALRELGLTPREAYLATAKRSARLDSRAHLSDSFHGGVRAPVSSMSRSELLEARELFSDLDDRQIHELYKKVR